MQVKPHNAGSPWKNAAKPSGGIGNSRLAGICLSIMLSGNASVYDIFYRHFGLLLNIFDHSTLYYRQAA